MCDHHPTDLSRRRFAGLAAFGAGLSILPMRALAQTSKAAGPLFLGVMCIDYRYVNNALAVFNREAGSGNYDEVALAGAALAANSSWAFPNETPGFLEQLAVARSLHPDISRVIVLDHMECGAYKVTFGNMTPAQERAKHIEVAALVGPLLVAKGLTVKIFLAENPSTLPTVPIWQSPGQ